MAFFDGLRRFFRRLWPSGKIGQLYYFDEVLPVEFAVISERRRKFAKSYPDSGRSEEVVRFRSAPAKWFGRTSPEHDGDDRPADKTSSASRVRYPDPRKLFDDARAIRSRLDAGDSTSDSGGGGGGGPPWDEIAGRADNPDRDRMRPRPVPCDATGLALSGGGIRSAAVSLGALQALHLRGRLASVDYLSTVSGGGYIGACLSAAMSRRGGGAFPFGEDVFDSPAVAHLRNYSNYLMPRGRSGARNWGEAMAVVLRGLLANAVVVLAVLLPCVVITALIYADERLGMGSMTFRLLGAPFLSSDIALWRSGPFLATLILAGMLALVLLIWAVLRTFAGFDTAAGDTVGLPLTAVRLLLLLTTVAAILDFQPIAIALLSSWLETLENSNWRETITTAWGALAAFAGAVAAFAGAIGRFLEKSSRASGFRTLLMRGAAKAALLVAALVLPLALWALYLWLSGLAIDPPVAAASRTWSIPAFWPLADATPLVRAYVLVALVAIAISVLLTPNAYSLHRFYRDRLSTAFVFQPPPEGSADPPPLDDLKLSELRGGNGPYHIINAAMNVQGSAEANRRGRNADFFMMSSEFVGSDLTLYASTTPAMAATQAMEDIDARLNLATAMAISGAAVSANMGSNTVRLLSPTLALLNVRLGYWLRNPRAAARVTDAGSRFSDLLRRFREKLYLLVEMLNLLDEKSGEVYLTDGGHIENLGLYELLKRGCRAIIVIDAEADPAMSFASLLKVERYARIDLGIRISLPWEEIADVTRDTAAATAAGERPCRFGPHCAVGPITYEDETEGVLVYFKASMSGDERDYIRDYKVRNPDFPHETTGDQFFSEEQFEMYRALGFHIVDGFFEGGDDFALPRTHPANKYARDGRVGKALRARERNKVCALFPSQRP